MSHYNFSIITVVKNDQKNISKTIKSVLSQKNDVKLEYIIVDGKSTDSTMEIINHYKNEIDIIKSEEDFGIYDAMNKGLDLAKGEIVGFCNAGDLILPKGLLYVRNEFIQNNCDYVFGTVRRKYLKDTILKHGLNEKRIYYNFDFATAHSTGFYVKKKIINTIGKYNLSFKCSSDYDYYFRLIKSKKFLGSYTKINEIVGEVDKGGFSSKLTFTDHLIEETKIRIHNKQNIIFIFIIAINAIFKNLYKKFFD